MWYTPPILRQYEMIVHIVDPKSTQKLTLLNIEKRGFVTLDSQILVKGKVTHNIGQIYA